MSNSDGKHVNLSEEGTEKSIQKKKNLIVQSLIFGFAVLEPLCKQVSCCILPIRDTDTPQI